jgi:hypothetical protein
MKNDVFDEIASLFRAQTKLDYLRDIAGQIEEDEEIAELIEGDGRTAKKLVVTFDRRRNDNRFSYSHADLLLVVLDRLSGGAGIEKPLNQVRVLTSKWTRSQLLKILRYFSRNNREIKFRRILILPYPGTIVGHRLDPAIYKK